MGIVGDADEGGRGRRGEGDFDLLRREDEADATRFEVSLFGGPERGEGGGLGFRGQVTQGGEFGGGAEGRGERQQFGGQEAMFEIDADAAVAGDDDQRQATGVRDVEVEPAGVREDGLAVGMGASGIASGAVVIETQRVRGAIEVAAE